MRRLADSASWLAGARSTPWSCHACRARFASTRAQKERKKGGDSTTSTPPHHGDNSSQPRTGDDDLGYSDWAEVNAADKTIDTPIGPLPISPLLDPSWQAAKRRAGPKLQPPELSQMPRVQRQTYGNPYARLLAEPVRMCQLTRARLPRPFLTSFGLVADPKQPDDGQVWWVSADVVNGVKKVAKSTLKSAPKEEHSSTAEQIKGRLAGATKKLGHQLQDYMSYDLQLPGRVLGTLSALESEPEVESTTVRDFRAPVHVLARQDLLASFMEKNTKYAGGYLRFGSVPGIGKLANGAVWRKDMHHMILETLRFKVAAELAFLATLVKYDRLSMITSQDVRGPWIPYWARVWARLQLRPDSEVADDDSPFRPPYVPQRLYDRPIPTYDLPSLLGPGIMAELKLTMPKTFTSSSWAIIGQIRGVNLALQLFRLQAYVANYEQPMEEEKKAKEE